MYTSHIWQQVLRPQVQVQVLQSCTGVQLEYKRVKTTKSFPVQMTSRGLVRIHNFHVRWTVSIHEIVVECKADQWHDCCWATPTSRRATARVVLWPQCYHLMFLSLDALSCEQIDKSVGCSDFSVCLPVWVTASTATIDPPETALPTCDRNPNIRPPPPGRFLDIRSNIPYLK